jgi:hypothetical protein
MYLYNVTVNVDQGIHETWLDWMKQVHIPEVMSTGMFKTYRICRLIQPAADDGVTYAVQYYCDTRELLDRYFQDFAPVLQQEHLKMFGSRAMAFRTILEVL